MYETFHSEMKGKFEIRIQSRKDSLFEDYKIRIVDTQGGNIRTKEAKRMSTIKKFMEEKLNKYL